MANRGRRQPQSGVVCGRDGSSTARPDSQPLTSEGKRRANELPYMPHTRDLSYVANQIHLFMSRFVQTAMNDDSGVRVSWETPTRVGVIVSN